MATNLSTKRGDTWNGAIFEILLNGSALDLTGATILCQLKKNKSDNTAVVEFTELDGITITDAPNGVFRIDETIINVVPKAYYYDIQVTLQDGTVITPVDGTFTVSEDVSR